MEKPAFILSENDRSYKRRSSKTIGYLAEKGVNVTEIENQTKVTEDKIAELDEKLETLPEIKEKLIQQYQKEKEEQLKVNKNKDYVRERAAENRTLFNAILEVNPVLSMSVKDSSDIVLSQKEDINIENNPVVIRKR